MTDTHFGIKNNSLKWLKKQIEGLNELKEFIKDQDEPVTLIHCGDVFDCRSAINMFVLKNIRDIFNEIADMCEHFYIIAGNHDYYSPVENNKHINTIDLVFSHKNITTVSQDSLVIDNVAFVPWYDFERCDFSKYNLVFTHGNMYNLPVNSKVIAGHIHTPFKAALGDKYNYNIGSFFATTFADANQERGFYVLYDDDDELVFHPLCSTIKFFNVYSNADDDKFFVLNPKIRNFDYLRIYITVEHHIQQRYLDMIAKYRTVCDNVDVIIYNELMEENDESFLDINAELNFDYIIEQKIPENLLDKFKNVKKKFQKH